MTTDQIQWWASLPRAVIVAAASLITTNDGRWLMLKSTYRAGWQLPGGIVEARESPRAGAVREVREETGLEVEMGALRCLDFRSPPLGAPGPPPGLHFLFAGPSYAEPPELTLQAEEIAEAAWLEPDRAIELAIPGLRKALTVIVSQAPAACSYLENGVSV